MIYCSIKTLLVRKILSPFNNKFTEMLSICLVEVVYSIILCEKFIVILSWKLKECFSNSACMYNILLLDKNMVPCTYVQYTILSFMHVFFSIIPHVLAQASKTNGTFVKWAIKQIN